MFPKSQPSEVNCHYAFCFQCCHVPCEFLIWKVFKHNNSVVSDHGRGWILRVLGTRRSRTEGGLERSTWNTCRDAHQDYASYRKAMQKLYESNRTLAVDKKIQSIFHSISDRLTIYFSFFMFILEGPPTVMTLCQQVVKSELRHKKETRIQDFSCRGACNT